MALETSQEHFREVSLSPRAYLIDQFLSSEECEALKELAAQQLTKAQTINRSTGEAFVDKVRTNSQFYFDRSMAAMAFKEGPCKRGLGEELALLAVMA